MTTKTYITNQGDMWDGISYKLWGNEYHVAELIEANPRHVETSVFSGGIVLNVPEIAEPALAHGLPPWRR